VSEKVKGDTWRAVAAAAVAVAREEKRRRRRREGRSIERRECRREKRVGIGKWKAEFPEKK
jgi:hypothetical protein